MASKSTYDRFFAALREIRGEAAGSWNDKKAALDAYLKDDPEAQAALNEIIEWYKDENSYAETGTAHGETDAEAEAKQAVPEAETENAETGTPVEDAANPENATTNDSKVS